MISMALTRGAFDQLQEINIEAVLVRLISLELAAVTVNIAQVARTG